MYEKSKWFNNIIKYKTVTSTQDIARELYNKGYSEGTVVTAEIQTAGRGRFKRKWFSGKGGLWMSIILTPNLKPQKVMPLSLVVSLAISDTINKMTNIKTELKWPNDIVVYNKNKGIYKKLAGMLVETVIKDINVNLAVVGIGINIKNKLPVYLNKTAITLDQLGACININLLTKKLIDNISKYYNKFKMYGFKKYREPYLSKLVYKDKTIKIIQSPSINYVEGILKDVDNQGQILVQVNNKLKKINTGEIVA